MGILEDLLAGAVSGGAMGGRPQPRSGGAGGLGGSGALAALLPIVIAMLANRQRGAPPGESPPEAEEQAVDAARRPAAADAGGDLARRQAGDEGELHDAHPFPAAAAAHRLAAERQGGLRPSQRQLVTAVS